jgi:hypothetical protein
VIAAATAVLSQVIQNLNVPKAPPINWFFSWIKKEPFGENVPLFESTRNAMPEPIAKVDQGGMSDDSLDLSAISAELATGGGRNN